MHALRVHVAFSLCMYYRMILAVFLARRRVGPQVWCRQRSTEWWRGVLAGLHGDGWWRENLRMTRETFETVCDELRPHLERQTTRFRQPVSVEARIAVTIWRLATNVEYRTIAALFGLGRSTIGEIVLDTCDAIALFLLPRYVRVPQDALLQEIVDGFLHRWGFPQTVGAIDGTHIPIIRPIESASDYYNRKGYYSVLMQALVDFRGLFMDINIGWPGKVHDARVFANSSLYKKASNGTLLPNQPRVIGGVEVPLIILGDPAYPLLPWLMKPYLENSSTTSQERQFNYRQSRARMVVENAFGRLKGRWRCLLKRMDTHVCNVPNIVASCVVLHNVCELYGDHCSDDWVVNVETTRSASRNTSTSSTSSTSSSTASSIRNAIRDSL